MRENALSDATTFSLNKLTDDLQKLRAELRESVEIGSPENPLVSDLGGPTSPIDSEQMPDEDARDLKPTSSSKGLTLIQHLDDVLDECKVMKALLERKHTSTPHLVNSTTPPSAEHKYTPYEVSELLTQNRVAAQERKKLRLEIPQPTIPKQKIIRPTVSAPTTPLRISSRSPPIMPKSPERSASPHPHIMTIEEAFEKEEEERSYRNFCDEEIDPPAVTILEDEEKPPKENTKPFISEALFGSLGKTGNIGNSSKNSPYFRGRYDPCTFERNLIAEVAVKMLV